MRLRAPTAKCWMGPFARKTVPRGQPGRGHLPRASAGHGSILAASAAPTQEVYGDFMNLNCRNLIFFFSLFSVIFSVFLFFFCFVFYNFFFLSFQACRLYHWILAASAARTQYTVVWVWTIEQYSFFIFLFFCVVRCFFFLKSCRLYHWILAASAPPTQEAYGGLQTKLRFYRVSGWHLVNSDGSCY